MITINESKRKEITIEHVFSDIFGIKYWDKKTGNCEDSIFLNESDINKISYFINNYDKITNANTNEHEFAKRMYGDKK
tara:strand:- start:1048 stop:1281 length:234 start_codon:yes stop_codon:yes gene_type:complete